METNSKDKKKYTHRLLARIVIEAATPLAVGSGEKSIMTDSLVATDANGLPYIPGTAIAGVLRHLIGEEEAKTFFGNPQKGKQTGSEIIFTEAKLVGKDGKAIDGLKQIDTKDGQKQIDTKDGQKQIDTKIDFYQHYLNLPIRQHNSIDKYGTVRDTGKFDEQVVYKGSRFCFEIEMVSDGSNTEDFNKVLNQMQSSQFRLGGGTTCGFGEVKVVKVQARTLDMQKVEDRTSYASKSSCLSSDWAGWKENEYSINKPKDEVTAYELRLQPDDFFLFGSGYGDDDADMTPVKETVLTWYEDGKFKGFEEKQTLIPATSVKGALAHRVAFHYNKFKEYFVGNDNAKVLSENEAVRQLFGYADEKGNRKGCITLSDVFLGEAPKEKVVPHVAIDRFMGGTIPGALFNEKVSLGKGREIRLHLYLHLRQGKYGEKVVEALEQALSDICNGLLPLGGGVNRGNGTFKGTLTKKRRTHL